MIQLNNVILQRGKKVLLENASLTIYAKQKVGLIGANGSGKSSLFGLLLGEYQPDSGNIELPKQTKFAYLAQEIANTTQPAIEYVMDGDTELRELEQQLEQASAEDNYQKIANLHLKLDAIDAYTAKTRAAKLLTGLGFPPNTHNNPVNSFSGGWQMRLNLAKTLMCRSDILLLDEPTNHLDLDAVLWLEIWLKNYPGTLLLISHDRDFLDGTVDTITHLEHKTLKIYTGNYSSFEQQRATALSLQQAQYEKQQRQIAHAMAFVNRFRAKASKAKQAQSRLKALEKMEIIQAAHVDSEFNFEFRKIEKCPNPILQLNNVTIGYDATAPVLTKVNLSIIPGMRIGLLGANGAGKSTLIKLIAEELAPLSGQCHTHKATKIGYYSQHIVDQLDLTATPLQQIQNLDKKTSTQELRNFLGGFNFSGDMATTPIHVFSGGEKARLALALLVWQNPNLLLLDEPTNHLDLDMRTALTIALQGYQGALIIVSHDRHLLRSTTDEFFLVANHSVQAFEGDLEDYHKWMVKNRNDDSKKTIDKQNITQSVQPKKNNHQLKKQLESKLRKLDNELEKFKTKLLEIDAELHDADIYTTNKQARLNQCLKQQKEIQQKIQALETEWLEITLALDEIES